ncbi:MAG: hypothetical protein ICV83_27505 [Cytophagales bacterium]|nr:hypothetical protein [Cytophagales bacterium]
MEKTMNFPQTRPATGWVATATLSLLLTFGGLTARAQTDHSGSPPRTGGTAPLPKGATTDKGTYTSQDTVGRKAAGSTGTYGNTSTGTGLPSDSTGREGDPYGSSGNTGPRPDTTGSSRSGAPSDTIGGGGKASHESGSRTNDGAQLNRNRTKGTGSVKKQ